MSHCLAPILQGHISYEENQSIYLSEIWLHVWRVFLLSQNEWLPEGIIKHNKHITIKGVTCTVTPLKQHDRYRLVIMFNLMPLAFGFVCISMHKTHLGRMDKGQNGLILLPSLFLTDLQGKTSHVTWTLGMMMYFPNVKMSPFPLHAHRQGGEFRSLVGSVWKTDCVFFLKHLDFWPLSCWQVKLWRFLHVSGINACFQRSGLFHSLIDSCGNVV